ncbi:MAG TPA: DUF1800 domain-containing protein [Actinomycetota bacterium]|jgi:uncharacterized protein (DUF1800 family)
MTQTVARRDVFKAAAAAMLGSPIASLLTAEPALADAAFVPSDLDLHVLRRATYGPTPALRDQIKQRGRWNWLDDQLDPDSVNDAYCDDLINDRFPHLDWTIAKAVDKIDDGSWDLMFDLGVAAIVRATWSKRQLFEVMVDFWSNHLNVTNPFDGGWATRHDYDRKVIRQHALGRFEDMLIASATHPAMMYYLNNAESTKDLPNENYGRELLELHTVGVAAGYSETDMYNSTLVMTGYGVNWETQKFQYHDWAHYVGPVQVMDWSSNNGSASHGYDVGLNYLRYLANHESTAQHIASKLVTRFVSDEPDQALVDKLANTYLNHDTAIVPVLRQLFHSAAFEDSIGAKVRRPMEDVIATLRILGDKPDKHGRAGLEGLYWLIEGLGNTPMGWVPPNGYPDVADAWRSAGGTLGRWNMHMSLAAKWWPDTLVRPPLKKMVPDPLPATHGKLVDALAKRLVFRKLTAEHTDAVLAIVERTSSDPLSDDDAIVGWRLPYVVAAILDSPYHATR